MGKAIPRLVPVPATPPRETEVINGEQLKDIVAGLDPIAAEMLYNSLAERFGNGPKLSDTVPPTEPPKQPTTAKPQEHFVVKWYYTGRRVTRTKYGTRELALNAMQDTIYLEYRYCYAVALSDGRDILLRRDIAGPPL